MVWTEPQPAAVPGTLDLIIRFVEAVNRRNLTSLSALLADDTVLENTGPAPDGMRYQGKTEVLAYWQSWFASNRDARFDVEDLMSAGDRCVVRWICRKTRDGKPWHLRGVDVYTIRDLKVVSRMSYVKG